MNSKLTLRIDDGLIALAKAEAAQRGKSVSQMVGEFIDLLGHVKAPAQKIPPVTASLRGVLKGVPASEESYKKHLREKYG
ncbi:MAG: antitoxin [Kiritimatiellales bacterium]|nr:antitoxin [Kiritimatiellota bacterium]MBL7012498.1 antitoxin [Kiritimatiellales bacterium]